MNKQPRSLFAVIVRGDSDEATDLVLDYIERSGVNDKEWDWVVWTRGTSVYFIISAPLLVKGAISDIPNIKILPVGSVSEKLNDNRNDWIEPVATSEKGALEVAESLIDEWVELQFIKDEMTKAAASLLIPPKVKERTRIASRSEVYSSTRRREGRTQQHAENTIVTLGLNVAKDSQGRGFTFKNLG